MAARYGGDKTQLGGKGIQTVRLNFFLQAPRDVPRRSRLPTRSKRTASSSRLSRSSVCRARITNLYIPFFLFVGVQNLPDIEEVNMFKDDNSIVNFRKPLSKPFPILTRFSSILRPREPPYRDWRAPDQAAEGLDARNHEAGRPSAIRGAEDPCWRLRQTEWRRRCGR